MKNIANLFKALSLALFAGIFCVQVKAQVVGDQYNNDHQNDKVQHKPAKWYTLAIGHNTNMDSFEENGDDQMIPATEGGQSIGIQNTHTLVDTIYMVKGHSIRLTIPDWLNNNANNQSYQRWYNYETGGTFAHTGDNGVVDLLTPATEFTGRVPDNGTGFRFANGYIGDPLSTSGRLYAMDFFYPEDDPHPHYIVACDVSGYTDFSENFNQNENYGKSWFASRGYWEPTLGHRFLYYIIALDENVKVPIDVKNITMPATRIPNMTEEMVALSRDARAYAMNGQGPDDVNLSVHLENNEAGISLITESLKGESRVIHFSYNKSENSDGTVSLPDGSTASLVVRNGSTEVARFNLTFVEEARLLSQSQVKDLNSGDFSGSDGSNWHRLSYRTPKNLEEDTNYEFHTNGSPWRLDYRTACVYGCQRLFHGVIPERSV